MRAVGAFVLGACLLWLSQPALAAKRVALVMGNSAYQNVSRLTNPANDSEAMSATLKGAGFEVVDLRRDLKANDMRRALRDFSDRVRDADVAVVYFAGHGIEIDGTNYIIPVDALLERDIDAYDEAVPLDRLLTVIEPAKQLRLVILDACRDNPFNKSMKRTIGTRAIGRGLAKVEPTSPNTLIAFAAKAGSTASDGESKNSPFTSALVKYLPRPGLDLRKAFGFTRDDVLKATNNKQEPFVYGSLGGEDVSLVPAEAPAQPTDADAALRRTYELALQVGTLEVWDSFIANYPNSFYTDLAKAQRRKLAAEEARLAATEKARAAKDDQARLAAEGARAAEQARVAAQAKAAEEARIAAEKKKAVEDARVAEAERAKAAEVAKAAEQARVAAEKKALDDARIAEAERAKAAARTKIEADARLAADAAKRVADGKPQEGRPIGQLAAVAPTDLVVDAAKRPAAEDIPRLLQAELRRVGCNPGAGAIDGNWNAGAQKSLALFNKNAGTRLDVKSASLDALDAVRSKASRVCPLICDHGYKADGETCTKIVCKTGYEVGDDETCERIEPAKRAKPVAKLPPSSDRAAERPPVSSERRASSGSGLPACTVYCRQKYGGLAHFESRCLAYMGRCDHSR